MKQKSNPSPMNPFGLIKETNARSMLSFHLQFKTEMTSSKELNDLISHIVLTISRNLPCQNKNLNSKTPKITFSLLSLKCVRLF